MRKLIGNTDIDDSLEKLDKLTQEEARMASAELLKITHSVHDNVLDVGNKVEGIDNRVQGVDNKVQGVDSRVQGISSEVRGVDHKLDQVNRSLSF